MSNASSSIISGALTNLVNLYAFQLVGREIGNLFLRCRRGTIKYGCVEEMCVIVVIVVKLFVKTASVLTIVDHPNGSFFCHSCAAVVLAVIKAYM